MAVAERPSPRSVVVEIRVVILEVGGVVQRLGEDLVEVGLAHARGAVETQDEGLTRVGVREVVAHRVREEVPRGVLAVEVRAEVRAEAGARARGGIRAEGTVRAARRGGARGARRRTPP